MAVPPSLCQHCARFPRNATHHGHGGPRHPVRPLFSYWLALATTLGDGRSTGEEPTGVVRGLGWLVCFPPGQCTRVPLDRSIGNEAPSVLTIGTTSPPHSATFQCPRGGGRGVGERKREGEVNSEVARSIAKTKYPIRTIGGLVYLI